MTNEHLVRKTKTENATQPAWKRSLFLQLAEACARDRKLRIRMPLPRRESCLTRRAMIAALREAEHAEWDATGGVSLRGGLIKLNPTTKKC